VAVPAASAPPVAGARGRSSGALAWEAASRASHASGLVDAAGAPRLPTGAVHAPLLGARPAPAHHPLAERLPGAEEADCRIVRRDPDLGGKVTNREAIHLHPAQRLRVLGLQGLGQSGDAATDRGALVGRWLEWRLLDLFLERGQRALRSAPPSIVVD